MMEEPKIIYRLEALLDVLILINIMMNFRAMYFNILNPLKKALYPTVPDRAAGLYLSYFWTDIELNAYWGHLK